MSENPQGFQGTGGEPNPLTKYFRQPKQYIKLPSNGYYYPEGKFVPRENDEHPVYPMTARDELALKTPDALLNGQATVDVIQSCFPDVKDAWNMPSIDLDAVLIAIRIATYGEMMDVSIKAPGTGEEKDFQVDLRQLLDQLTACEFENVVEHNGMRFNLRPLTYQEFTKNALKTFEEQRIINVVNNDELSEEEKLQHFANSFSKLTQMTVNSVIQGIHSIEVDGTTVSNRQHIEEFVQNADKEFYTAITDHLEKQKEKFSIQPMEVSATEEEIAAGAPETYTVPITFDAANFFGSKS